MVAGSRPVSIAAVALGLACSLLLSACGDTATLPSGADSGAEPQLVAPHVEWIPTVRIAPAVGWPDGATPVPAAGLRVQAFARGLDHPRWLLALANGDVLVAETNAPPKPDDGLGIKGWFMALAMRRAGAATATANRLTLLRDRDGDGVAEQRFVLLENLNSPFGMAVVGEELYVANTDAVLVFPFRVGQTRIDAVGRLLVSLPAGRINHHWTKNLLASPDGKRLYVSVGSNSNVGERGALAEFGRAAIWEVDTRTGAHRVFAAGLRNPNGMAWSDDGAQLWAVVNERDEIGGDLVPDYLTSVRDGAFYGWPYSYYGAHIDERVAPARADLVAAAIAPDYALGAHTASLGLVAGADATLPEPYAGGMFIGQHGSWNRRPFSGYRVIFVPFAAGRPSGAPIAVLTGFLSPKGQAFGRPVGVAVDRLGALLVADDVGDTVWRVSGAQRPQQQQ